MRAVLTIAIALAAAIGVAAIAWIASRGHIILFPLVLLFGLPLVPWLGRRKSG